ncbi:hypothetical protein VCHA48O428_40318 [Vibrio chagasii]|nr:hypothetical protein VCHA48O428_40318 [Vibrio chagasii]
MTAKTSRYLLFIPIAVLILGYSLSAERSLSNNYSLDQGNNEYGAWLKHDNAYFNYNSGYDVAIYNKKESLGIALVHLDKSCKRPSKTTVERTISFNEVPINFKHSCIDKDTASLFPLTMFDEDSLLDVFTYKYGVILHADHGDQAFFKTDGVNEVISFLNKKYL